MVEVVQEKDIYRSAFARLEAEPNPVGGSALIALRRQAMARFAELGFPTLRHEDWRYTNVARIAKTEFRSAVDCGVDLDERAIVAETFPETQFHRLVFVNGVFAGDMSTPQGLPKGVQIASLAETLQENPSWVEKHLARYASYQDHAFTALNTALMEDGAFVYVPKGIIVEQPIHILYVTVPGVEPIVVHPRNLIIADEASQVTIIESYVGLGEGVYFTNAVTEISVGEGAVVDHYKVQRESTQAYHVGTTQLYQRRSSTASSHTISIGGGIVRNDINAVLDGEGCDGTLNGLYVPVGKQHVDNHLRVEHRKPHGNSREHFKGILDDSARGVFTGRIIVHEDAQKTDAKQTNRNLLLSDSASVDTKPQLEIFADDVKCTHGATIGQLDEDAMFYLRARGISADAARSLLVFAFAGESIAKIKPAPVRAQVQQILLERLPQGDQLQGLS
jgi:Fe-S cluster assembly protein SufD